MLRIAPEKTPLWEAKFVLGPSCANPRTSGAEIAGTSNKSECTRGSEMSGASLAFSHSVRGDGETDSAMRRYVPRPSAIARARYHVSYCALRAEARFGAFARHAEGKPDLSGAVGHLAVWAKALGEAVRSNSTKYQEQARQPCQESPKEQ
jgi:hypothetical protein